MHAMTRRRIGRQPARLQIGVAADLQAGSVVVAARQRRLRQARRRRRAGRPRSHGPAAAASANRHPRRSAAPTRRPPARRPTAAAARRPRRRRCSARESARGRRTPGCATVSAAMPPRRSTAWKAVLSRPARWPRSAWPTRSGSFSSMRVLATRVSALRHSTCRDRSSAVVYFCIDRNYRKEHAARMDLSPDPLALRPALGRNGHALGRQPHRRRRSMRCSSSPAGRCTPRRSSRRSTSPART